jgi:hypothetical protein
MARRLTGYSAEYVEANSRRSEQIREQPRWLALMYVTSFFRSEPDGGQASAAAVGEGSSLPRPARMYCRAATLEAVRPASPDRYRVRNAVPEGVARRIHTRLLNSG